MSIKIYLEIVVLVPNSKLTEAEAPTSGPIST